LVAAGALVTVGFAVSTTGFVLTTAGVVLTTTGFVLTTAGVVLATAGFATSTTGFVLTAGCATSTTGFVLTAGFATSATGFVTAAASGFVLAESGAAAIALTVFGSCVATSGFSASGGVEVGFACAAAAANFAASTDGSGLLAGTTPGGFALGETENGSGGTGGKELTVDAGADAFAAAGVEAGCEGAGVEDGRGGAGDEGPAFGAALGVTRGTKPEARRAVRPEEGGPDGRELTTPGATGAGVTRPGCVRGSDPKMSSSSPQPESTFCSSLSGAAGAGLLLRAGALGAAGDASQAESSVSPSAVLIGGDSASFMERFRR
jgi:hypothetical protein